MTYFVVLFLIVRMTIQTANRAVNVMIVGVTVGTVIVEAVTVEAVTVEAVTVAAVTVVIVLLCDAKTDLVRVGCCVLSSIGEEIYS